MAGFLGGLFSSDMAIDLGTANTLVYVKDQGIVLKMRLAGAQVREREKYEY